MDLNVSLFDVFSFFFQMCHLITRQGCLTRYITSETIGVISVRGNDLYWTKPESYNIFFPKIEWWYSNIPFLPQISGSPFTDCDVSIFEAFAIFCGLGIHNTQMYENACKLMAKQKVALECLSYHATASQHQTQKLIQDPIREAECYNLYSFKFIGKFWSAWVVFL